VQPGERLVAYADLTVPLNGGRYLLQPMVVARLVQAAEIAEGQRVLIVAAGTGYLASIVAALGAQVTALEENEALLATGRAYTTDVAPSVVWRQGPLSAGDTQGQPFDVIVFDGAIPSIPAFCAAQCAENGRVAGIMRFDDKTSSIFIARKNGESSWNARRYLDVEAPVIPAFEKPSSFSL
jgi:protein-L-isoaspartate(D-aspartate) O-methyltransferase